MTGRKLMAALAASLFWVSALSGCAKPAAHREGESTAKADAQTSFATPDEAVAARDLDQRRIMKDHVRRQLLTVRFVESPGAQRLPQSLRCWIEIGGRRRCKVSRAHRPPFLAIPV